MPADPGHNRIDQGHAALPLGRMRALGQGAERLPAHLLAPGAGEG